jgi:flagellar L-ring protein precursor FlgH
VKQLSLLALFACAACGSMHTPYVVKQRDYKPATATGSGADSGSPGSLWREGRPASMLFTDARALRENDLVVVRVEEVADARRSSDTDLQRQSKMQLQIDALLKTVGTSSSTGNGAGAGLNTSSDSSFHGEGSTGRTERLTATVPATVKKVLPNGNLFIEGHRVVLVNSEEQHFYISGVVRPIDIDQDNSVKSSMVAEAEIEFTGRGVLTDNQKQGFLQKMLGWIWPF